MALTRTERKISKLVRAAVNASGSPYPIKIVDGFAAPELHGRSYYWTTPSGKTEVRHPNAYGYPTLYHPSTLHIVVGAGWVLQSLLNAEWEEQEKRRELRELLNTRLTTQVRFTSEGGIAQ